MKLIRIFLQKLRKIFKTLPSLNTEVSLEYSKVKFKVGDGVTIISDREIYNGKVGVILDIIDDSVNKIEIYQLQTQWLA